MARNEKFARSSQVLSVIWFAELWLGQVLILITCLTSAYMARTYPGQYRHITAFIRVRNLDQPKCEETTGEDILHAQQLHDLLDWLEANESMVFVWACLQGLCGLRIQEAAYLREQDIVLGAQTVRITAVSAHTPKNRHSYRTIPICPKACKAIGAWLSDLKTRHREGHFFFPSKAIDGRESAKSREARAGVFRRETIGSIWSEAIHKARIAGVQIPKKFVPRKLRATFVTAMRTGGADYELLQAYIGQKPGSVLTKHYDRVKLSRFTPISMLAQAVYEDPKKFLDDDISNEKPPTFEASTANVLQP